MLALSIADRSHLRRQAVETDCKNERCQLHLAAARRGLLLLSYSSVSQPF
jgi:hypothetical protein